MAPAVFGKTPVQLTGLAQSRRISAAFAGPKDLLEEDKEVRSQFPYWTPALHTNRRIPHGLYDQRQMAK
jgi:hypothetical protein